MQTEPANNHTIIESTRNWIREVVIGLNFCPFARKPFTEEKIVYQVDHTLDQENALKAFQDLCHHLDAHPEIETALLIFSTGFSDFDDYLDLVQAAEEAIEDEGYEGIYQVASFHPEYLFAGSDENDPANYTNRSPYPMLHILREDLLEIAIEKHAYVEAIPGRNIAKAKTLGLAYFKMMRFD
jgi:hypothetical protein